jgi:hypothetical protein
MLLYTHTLEVHTEFATLYLRGILTGADIGAARATCSRLPQSIRLLRLDVHGMHSIDADAKEGIAALVRDWRAGRLGHVIISAGIEDLASLAVDSPAKGWTPIADSFESALMATYL